MLAFLTRPLRDHNAAKSGVGTSTETQHAEIAETPYKRNPVVPHSRKCSMNEGSILEKQLGEWQGPLWTCRDMYHFRPSKPHGACVGNFLLGVLDTMGICPAPIADLLISELEAP